MPMLKSEKVILRAVEPGDVDYILECENDSSAWRVSDNRAPFSRRLIERYVEEYTANPLEEGQLRLIIMKKTTRAAVGIIDLFDVEPYHGRAKVGIYISVSERRRGLASQALETICRYSRDILGLRILSATILMDNTESESLFARCGFEKVATLSGWHRVGADTYSVNLMLRYL